ncbi:MAG: hypothetical protein WC798_00355 [Candidatus Paceibacterota bacterium]|jgi:hypothetical protein
MTEVLFAIGMSIIFIFSLFALLFTLLRLRDSLFVEIPFISTRRRAVESVVNALSLSDKSVLYDLGCGNAEVLKTAIQKTPRARGVGIEQGYIPFILSKVKTRKMPIIIHHQDIFDTDLSNASHIYCYLSDSMMQKLSHKFLHECKKGARIVSCDFQVPNIPLIQTISLEAKNDTLARSLYIYQI